MNNHFINAMLTKARASHKTTSYKVERRITTPTIVSYDKSRDEKLVSDIALKAMPKLMSDVTKRNREELHEKAVMPVINSPHSITKVYLIDGEAVGFINYYTYAPWYINFVPSEFHLRIKDHATIQMLAVDENHQKKGIGAALIKNALKELEKEYVGKVSLGTTDANLDGFYEKLGFDRKGGSVLLSNGPSRFTKYIAE
jgi:ribosomal protein S18 acetylase RimI-like enzyme